MILTLDQALKGKATQIKGKEYLSTEAYITPFLERMSKFTDDFRIQAIPADQISISEDNEDIVYNRMWIQAVLPQEYAFENHKESINLLYALDTRKPLVKIFRNALNMACLNMCVWNASFLDVKELNPESAINYKPLNTLMELTEESHSILTRLNNTEVPYNQNNIDESLGKWIRNALETSYDNGFGKVKVGIPSIMDAYKLLYIDNESPYYIKKGEITNLFNVYNAHTQVISNDKKDIVNKFEKCGLIGRILGITDF